MVNCSVCNSHKWRSSARDLPAGLWSLTAVQPAQTWIGQQRHQLGSHAQLTLTSTARDAITSRVGRGPLHAFSKVPSPAASLISLGGAHQPCATKALLVGPLLLVL